MQKRKAATPISNILVLTINLAQIFTAACHRED